MLKLLEDIAYNIQKREAFLNDKEAFLDNYKSLTNLEKELLIKGNSQVIESYLINNGASGEALYASAPVIIIIILNTDINDELMLSDNFSQYWDRVSVQANQLNQ
jgi:hypothetical protein